MPDRESSPIWIDELNPPHVRLTWSHYPWQNSTHIKRRVDRLAQKYSRGWHCEYCGELMPVWKRVDARYCCESCRKMAARKRRVERLMSLK